MRLVPGYISLLRTRILHRMEPPPFRVGYPTTHTEAALWITPKIKWLCESE